MKDRKTYTLTAGYSDTTDAGAMYAAIEAVVSALATDSWQNRPRYRHRRADWTGGCYIQAVPAESTLDNRFRVDAIRNTGHGWDENIPGSWRRGLLEAFACLMTPSIPHQHPILMGFPSVF